jgi:hypothetical protein
MHITIYSTVFWTVTPCMEMDIYRRFGNDMLPPSEGGRVIEVISSSGTWINIY